MARLPVPGADLDAWGDILNSYLLTEHNPDGTHNAPANHIGVTPSGLILSTNVQAALEEVAARQATGPAGGKLTGSYPNPQIAAGAITDTEVANGATIAEGKLALASDAAVSTPSRRTLGAGSTQAMPGDTPVMRLISNQTLGTTQTTITFSSIPATYKHLMIVMTARGEAGATTDFYRVQFNADSTSGHYKTETLFASAAAAGAALSGLTTALAPGQIPAGLVAGPYAGEGRLLISSYATSNFYKTVLSELGWFDNTNYVRQDTAGFWLSQNVINRVDIFLATNQFSVGSQFSLYGLL